MPKLLDAIAEAFRTWATGDRDLDLDDSPARLCSTGEEFFAGSGRSWPDLVNGLFQVATAAASDARNLELDLPRTGAIEQVLKSEGGSTLLPEIEDGNEFSLPDMTAFDVPLVARAAVKRTVAVTDLVAGLVLTGVWQGAGTVGNAGRRARKKFTRERA
jgi:hypothetical protein